MVEADETVNHRLHLSGHVVNGAMISKVCASHLAGDIRRDCLEPVAYNSTFTADCCAERATDCAKRATASVGSAAMSANIGPEIHWHTRCTVVIRSKYLYVAL